MNKWRAIGVLFCIAALCLGIGTINHILYTGEGIISSICLTLGCVCMAIACLKSK